MKTNFYYKELKLFIYWYKIKWDYDYYLESDNFYYNTIFIKLSSNKAIFMLLSFTLSKFILTNVNSM